MANCVSPDNEDCREQSKKEQFAVASAGLWNPNVRFLHLSSKTDLVKDALASQQLSAKPNDEAHHGETTVPLFSERRETELCVIHG